MPVAWSISHPLRLVRVVAREELSLIDFQRLMQSIDDTRSRSYRKIIDLGRVTRASPARTQREFVRMVRLREAEGATGPIAVVASTEAAQRQAAFFAAAAAGKRLVEVFADEGAARRWLDSFYSYEADKMLSPSPKQVPN